MVGGELAQYTAELFNPLTGRFTKIGTNKALNAGRFNHTATLLLNGQVLIAGGFPGRTSCELFDPSTQAFTTTGSMNYGRYFDAAVLLPDGEVLVAGSWPLDPTAEIYDPTDGSWGVTGTMATGRSRLTATLLQDGRVLVVGGTGSFANMDAAELFTP